jgi:predicted TIM-barrel fold metal-dependent hydrolase
MNLKESNPQKSLVERWSWHEHDGDLLVAEMDRAKVDRAFLISYDSDDLKLWRELYDMKPEDFLSGKKYAKYFYKKYPDRFYWFTTLPDPRREDTLEVVTKDFQEGATGIKVFPAFINMNLNDPQLMAIFGFVRKQKKLVMVGPDDSEKNPKTPSLESLVHQLNEEVLNEFPDLRFQINHAGCLDPLLPDAKIVFDMARNHGNVFLSTAFLGYNRDDEHEYPFPLQLKRLHRLYDEVGIDKLMFATDWPWAEDCRKYVQDVDSIRRHCDFMSDEEKRRFLGLNALRYLGECS